MTTDIPSASMRVRFDTRRRQLKIVNKVFLSPNMVRLDLEGDLTGFNSLGFDDHIKLFLPDPTTGLLVLPNADPNAPNEGPKPIMRDYTPRRFDVATGRLVIDFALHGHTGAFGANIGPATLWVMTAQVGDELNIGGPRGSEVFSDAFDTYVLVGDSTALPAIARRLEELKSDKKVLAIIEVPTLDDRLRLETRAQAEIVWLVSDPEAEMLLTQALMGRLNQLEGRVHIWAASEAKVARVIKETVMATGFEAKYIKSSGYWVKDTGIAAL